MFLIKPEIYQYLYLMFGLWNIPTFNNLKHYLAVPEYCYPSDVWQTLPESLLGWARRRSEYETEP